MEHVTPRAELLDEAKQIITGDRNVQYGEPTADFERTANVLNALEFTVSGKPLQPHHVAVIGAVLKLSRLTWSPGKYDHWLDIAGYAACGWECALEITPDPIIEEASYSQKVCLTDGKLVTHYYDHDRRFLRTVDGWPDE